MAREAVHRLTLREPSARTFETPFALPRSEPPPRAEPVKGKGPESPPSDVKLPEGAIDWERLWLATLRSPWTSLGFVPIGEATVTPGIAAALAAVGNHNNEGAVTSRDASQVSLATLKTELSALSAHRDSGDRTIVALPRLRASPAGLALARALDALVLCITFGESPIAEAEQVLADVGRARVLGTVIVRR